MSLIWPLLNLRLHRWTLSLLLCPIHESKKVTQQVIETFIVVHPPLLVSTHSSELWLMNDRCVLLLKRCYIQNRTSPQRELSTFSNKRTSKADYFQPQLIVRHSWRWSHCWTRAVLKTEAASIRWNSFNWFCSLPHILSHHPKQSRLSSEFSSLIAINRVLYLHVWKFCSSSFLGPYLCKAILATAS